MKKANITPLFKKKDKLNKDNYRSVNLLPIISKILERVLFNQVAEYMEPLLHKHLSGFRKGHSCQDILMKMTEDWRESLDRGLTVGAIAIDLSKAFDCMPHGLLLAKLSAYGFSETSCLLMKSYIMERQQRVKIGDTFSDWVNNIKGVPQGSILGPLLFNIFINDYLNLKLNGKVYNYADDNTISCVESDLSELKIKLQSDCLQSMDWFEKNNMKANASKFQLMFLSRNCESEGDYILLDGSEIKSSKSITILGVELDMHLKFNLHIDQICNQTGKQINALKRIRHYLDKESKHIIYNTYISSIFNYCSVVWMFTNKANAEKVEKTNKRAIRFATNKSHLDYETICKQENQLSIYRRCVKSVAIVMYKIKHGISPSYLRELFRNHETQYDMRDNHKLEIPQYNTVQYGKNSIRYFGAKLWNNIPVKLKTSVSLNTFKKGITKWLLTAKIQDIS